jgi:PAS domain S-box-containing protein
MLCLAACLISFFLVLRLDQSKAYDELRKVHALALTNVQTELTNAQERVTAVTRYVQYSDSITYSGQFLPITYADGYPKFVEIIAYGPRVLDSDKSAFINATRAIGPLYANFSMYTTNQPVFATPVLAPATAYYPVILGTMTEKTENVTPGFDRKTKIAILGWDIASPVNKQTTALVEATKKSSVSGVLTIPSSAKDPETGAKLFLHSTVWTLNPVFNLTTGALSGILGGSLGVEPLLDSQLLIIPDVVCTMYDLNATNDYNGGLFYHSKHFANNTDVLSYRTRSLYTISADFNFIDRRYKLVFDTTDNFIVSHMGTERWTGIVVSCIAFVIGEAICIAVAILLRLKVSIDKRAKSKRALTTLKDGYEKTKLLLGRIARQEAKARATLNAVSDFVITVNSTGRIIQTNKVFDKLFGYSETSLQQGLVISQVFTKLANDFFSDPKLMSNDEDVPIQTSAATNYSHDLDVVVVLKNLATISVGNNNTGIMSGDDDVELQEDEEAFVLVGKTTPKVTDVQTNVE